MIQIYDDILTEDFLDYVNLSITKDLEYRPHGSINKNTFLFSDVTSMFFYQYLFDKFIKKIDFYKNKNTFCVRSYVNLYPYNVGGDWHKDDGVDGSNYTLMFYPQKWKKSYKGNTLFKDKIDKIEYKQNRLVFFKGNIEHKAEEHLNEEFRFTLVYKIK